MNRVEHSVYLPDRVSRYHAPLPEKVQAALLVEMWFILIKLSDRSDL